MGMLYSLLGSRSATDGHMQRRDETSRVGVEDRLRRWTGVKESAFVDQASKITSLRLIMYVVRDTRTSASPFIINNQLINQSFDHPTSCVVQVQRYKI